MPYALVMPESVWKNSLKNWKNTINLRIKKMISIIIDILAFIGFCTVVSILFLVVMVLLNVDERK